MHRSFQSDRYQDDYALVTITDDSRYLVVPEGKVAPDDLDPDIVVIQQPVQNIYLGGFGGYGYVCVSGCIG